MSGAVPASAGVAPTLLETPWSPTAQDRIGYYGCTAGGGRLIRVGLVGDLDHKPPRAVRVACPACGNTHQVRPAWRRPTGDDKAPDLLIVAAEVDAIGAPERPMGMGSRSWKVGG